MLQRTTLNTLIIEGVLYFKLERNENSPNYGHYHITVNDGYIIQTSKRQTINMIKGLNNELCMFKPDDEVNHIVGDKVYHPLNLSLYEEIELYVYKIMKL